MNQWISFKLIHSVHTQSDLQFLSSINDLDDFSKIEFLPDSEFQPECHHSLSAITEIEPGLNLNSVPIMTVYNLDYESD